MFKKYHELIFIFLVLVLLGCSKKANLVKKPETIPPLNILYTNAYKEFEKGNWTESVELFQKVETRYSYSEWAPRATLMILYIHYDSNDSIQTLRYVEKFKKLYSGREEISYVDFIRAMTFYEQINVVSKDQTYTEVALKEFREIIKKYPNSIYAKESKLKIDLILEQLAGKEMYLARYYMNKNKWISALKRLNIVLSKYETTIYSTEALHRLVEIYYRLGNVNEAKKYAALLGYNFNDSDWYKKTYRIVKDKNYIIENKKQNRKLKDKIKKIFKFSK
ncbi:Beta-barrel assembly machine subunit BamD [alpha proteobacterium HIMB114]|nr:Beta-barrel assembly machine subunit BamD [alpha proteobacterium HIMB114]